MNSIPSMLLNAAAQTWTTFLHNWPFLVISVLMAVALKLYTDPQKISAFLTRYRRAGVIGATAAAVTTPLCSCGTTAIILGMIASTMPWSPIIAFMVASPLTSPQELIYSAGLFGWPFALAFFVSSIILGLLGGLAGEILDRRGWLKNQSRFASSPSAKVDPLPSPSENNSCAYSPTPDPIITARPSIIRRPQLTMTSSAGAASLVPAGEAVMSLSTCCSPSQSPAAARFLSRESIQLPSTPCACDDRHDAPCISQAEIQTASSKPAVTWRIFGKEALSAGKRLLLMFLGFAFIGYLINGLIPSAWVAAVFGQGNIYSVPLAATMGLPLYINTEATLPLISALIQSGMSQGAAMALLITGAGTSIGAMAGALTIARWRVIAVVIATLWLGAIAMGYLYDFILVSGLI